MRPRATDDVAPLGVPPLDLSPAALAAKRLAVYGGSFDPPHRGHLWVAERAREAFDLDHVVFVPARRPPHKPERNLAPDGDRLALLALLFGDRPWVSAWPGELRRAGPSFSYDTLRIFRDALAEDTELFMILGSDNLPGLSKWHRAEELLELAQPIVILRSATSLAREHLGDLAPDLEEKVVAGYMEVETFDSSASAIRAAQAEGRDPGPTFPGMLREYVRLRGLY